MNRAAIVGRAQSITDRIDRTSDRAIVAVLLIIGLLFAAPGLIKEAEPNSDGLFYEAQVLQLKGSSEHDALVKIEHSDRAREVAAIEDEGVVRVLDPAWVDYTAKFFHRRWVVPALALGVSESTGTRIERAVQDISMLGYALIAAAVFLLLRRRFPPSTSALVAVLCMLSPALYRWSFGQFVDSWGVLFETLGLLALILVADRGLKWLPLWIASMLLLSLTRDATMILGIAAFGLLLAQWKDLAARKRNFWLVGTGAAAALPALALGGAPVRENLAYILNGYAIPPDDSWGFVGNHYLAQLWATIQDNIEYPSRYGVVGLYLYLTIVVAIACIGVVVLVKARPDSAWVTVKGAIVGCVVLLLIADNAQGYRLELVFVPVVAFGGAWIVQWLASRAGMEPSDMVSR